MFRQAQHRLDTQRAKGLADLSNPFYAQAIADLRQIIAKLSRTNAPTHRHRTRRTYTHAYCGHSVNPANENPRAHGNLTHYDYAPYRAVRTAIRLAEPKKLDPGRNSDAHETERACRRRWKPDGFVIHKEPPIGLEVSPTQTQGIPTHGGRMVGTE